MVHRFLHLSDIHFGQEKDGTLVKHKHIRDKLIEDAESLAKSRGAVTRVIVTGDTAYSGKPIEYKDATDWLERLTAVSGCDETHVIVIPGNHDCDLDSISNQARMIYGQFRLNDAAQVQANLHRIHQDGEEASPFLPKLHSYREFARGYGCDFESPAKPLWMKSFDLPSDIRLRFIGLTSVQVSDLSDDVGNIVIGNEQYIIAEEKNVINVVLIHHPLHWFIDKKEATEHLTSNARVIMVGHEHDLNIEKKTNAFTKRECLAIFAGAVTPPEKEYSYTYNWLEFSHTEVQGKHFVVLDVFPRVWIQQNVSFGADRNRLGGPEDFVRIEIACSNLTPEPIKEGVTVATHIPVLVETFAVARDLEGSEVTSSVTSPVSVRQGGTAMDYDIVGFDRLRYLFWRYLDWRQRLKVLVAVDALPSTVDQPVPQTMEKLALETAARTSGKLHDLWEAMMPLVPLEKRAANPFKPKDR